MIRLSGQTRLSTFLRGNGEWIYVPPVPVFIEKLYGPFSQGPETQIYYNNNSLVYDPTSNGYYILGQFPYYGNEYVGRILRLDQTGSRDPNFNSGVGLGPPGFDGGVVTSDGKLVVFSQAGNYSGSNQSGNVFRINSNGTFDSTFSQGSANVTPILSMCRQSDGKILIGGSFTTYSGSSSNRIVRINPSGTVDSDFNIGTGFEGLTGFTTRVHTIVTQSDGKILVGGDFTVYNGVSSSGIVRLFPSGGIDPDFYTGSGFTGVTSNIVNCIAVQSDDKILVGGNYTSYSGSARNRIVRLTPSGTIDPDFNIGTGLNSAPYSIVQQPDGKILIGGGFGTYSGSTANRIVRINPSGSIDTSFNIGTGLSNTVTAMYLQSDGKIFVKGQFRTYSGSTEPNYDGLIRLNPSGTIDTTFVNRGVLRTISSFNVTNYGLCQQSDGKIIVGGDFIRYSSSVAPYIQRLNVDGTRDSSFNVGTGFNSVVYSVAQQSDGKILVVGSFSSYSGSSINRIVRLNPSGTIDTTFNVGTGFGSSQTNIIKQLSDGKILVGGIFTTYSGSTANRIVRLLSSGTIDPDFSTGTGFNSNVITFYEQSDGKILIGGDFTVYNGVSSSRIIRLNPSGGIDPDFYTGSGFNGTPQDIKQLPDGKIIVVGNFTTYSGSAADYIVRLNPSGTKDTTLNTGLNGFSSRTNSIVTQSEGKILVAGAFTNYSGSAPNFIVRINPSGSVDTTFNSGPIVDRGFNASVLSMIPLQNGNILAYGPFSKYSGSAAELSSYRGNLVEITPSGSIARVQIN